jgi:hypothetical protein
MNTPPSWMRTPEVLGNWLAARTSFAKNTSERLNQVSRVDAICWFITQVGHYATAKDIKRFATAFRGFFSHTWKYDRKKNKNICNPQALVACSSLLNSCYGGVGKDFGGQLYPTWYGKGENSYKHYGDVAPLYRPIHGNYSPTIGGLRRSARVQEMLDSNAKQI